MKKICEERVLTAQGHRQSQRLGVLNELGYELEDSEMSCEQPSNTLKHQYDCFRSAASLCIPHSALLNDEECCIPQDAPCSVDTSQSD